MRKLPWLSLPLLAMLLGVALTPFVASAQSQRNPVIFVHGLSGKGWNFADMVADFKRDGYTDRELDVWSYNWTQSNQTTAEQLAAEVDRVLARTGAQKVDIVAHSMGSLSSRWYLKFLGGTEKVDTWVSLGGPNHGTNLTPLCSWALPSCRDMAHGSEFLTRLNAGDETPGDVRYVTFWSTCDVLVNPDESVVLEGARNVEVGCVDHVALLFNDRVSQLVREAVR